MFHIVNIHERCGLIVLQVPDVGLPNLGHFHLDRGHGLLQGALVMELLADGIEPGLVSELDF